MSRAEGRRRAIRESARRELDQLLGTDRLLEQCTDPYNREPSVATIIGWIKESDDAAGGAT